MIIIDLSRQAEIDAHWKSVRAGLYKAQEHPFRNDAASTIEMHRHLASRHIERAAHHARQAEALAEKG